jgi:hypothetical protein
MTTSLKRRLAAAGATIALVAGGVGVASATSGSGSGTTGASASGATPSGSVPGGGAIPSGARGAAGRPQRLTGTTAAKVKAAALATVPNATFMSAMKDPSGGYHALLRKSDGTVVGVAVSTSFKATGTEALPAAPRGGGTGGGIPPSGGTPPSSGSGAPSGTASGSPT